MWKVKKEQGKGSRKLTDDMIDSLNDIGFNDIGFEWNLTKSSLNLTHITSHISHLTSHINLLLMIPIIHTDSEVEPIAPVQ